MEKAFEENEECGVLVAGGKYLTALRKEKGLRQEDVAKVLNVSRQAYLAYEKDRNKPNVLTLFRLAQLFDVNFDDFVVHFYNNAEMKKPHLSLHNGPSVLTTREELLIKYYRGLTKGEQKIVVELFASMYSKNSFF